MPAPLDAAEVAARLRDRPAWELVNGALQRTFVRAGFDGAIAFVNAVAGAASALDHHPDIALSWDEVTIRTWSHDANGVTERDFALARALDDLA